MDTFLQPTATLLSTARTGGYAIGAFNVFNLESAQAVVAAARTERSPVIMQITESTFDYAGIDTITMIARHVLARAASDGIPVALHLDHGKSYDIVMAAIKEGFSSVMYDGSRHPQDENIAVTRRVTAAAHTYGVSVQAELGNVPYSAEIGKDGVVDWDLYMTDPDAAAAFVAATKVDTLAVAIGNAHGFVQERSMPDFDRLARIRTVVDVPLVMHGASDWDADKVRVAISHGVSCFNIDTDSRIAFTDALAAYFTAANAAPQPRAYLGQARDAMVMSVAAKMRLFGSSGKA